MNDARPIYVGVGTCDCQRTDVRLYQVPGTPIAGRLLCCKCLAVHGFEAPRARTATDIIDVDGVLTWRK